MTEFESIEKKADHPHVHFIGIGGAGMGTIASILLDRGYPVSGSDVTAHDYTRRLSARGATVYLGHRAEQIDGAQIVVYSTAVPDDNVELAAARAAQIPVLHRSQMLAEVMKLGSGIAVAGAHGKTTTTSMIAYVLERAGLDPTFLVGGVVSNLDTGAKAGHSEWVIAEADESDGSFLNYRPTIAVVLNIEADHLEHYQGRVENLEAAYGKFMRLVPENGLLVTNDEDVVVRRLLTEVSCEVKTVSVRGTGADYYAQEITRNARGSTSTIVGNGKILGTLTLHVPGDHNIYNALCAFAVAERTGVPCDVALRALAEFHGALRRFQVLHDDQGILIVDDYAHHPTEIRATLTVARETGHRVIAVFQPQRYTRTYHLFKEFTEAFAEADDVLIMDIYSPVGEQPIAGVTASRLVDGIRESSQAAAKYCKTRDDVLAYLKEHVRDGDLVITMGAGDVWKIGVELSSWIDQHVFAQPEPDVV
ncbi:UDP-N-acetylmuramate--L-alanine ligase [Ferroacidibacillus organovorans]|nr:UDP-N-acetylmuramate--L-alanine ligase [Ferroacidibacillus organovorans]